MRAARRAVAEVRRRTPSRRAGRRAGVAEGEALVDLGRRSACSAGGGIGTGDGEQRRRTGSRSMIADPARHVEAGRAPPGRSRASVELGSSASRIDDAAAERVAARRRRRRRARSARPPRAAKRSSWARIGSSRRRAGRRCRSRAGRAPRARRSARPRRSSSSRQVSALSANPWSSTSGGPSPSSSSARVSYPASVSRCSIQRLRIPPHSLRRESVGPRRRRSWATSRAPRAAPRARRRARRSRSATGRASRGRAA